MGDCFFLNRVVVFGYSKKQRTVSTVIMKAEYIALSHTTREAV